MAQVYNLRHEHDRHNAAVRLGLRLVYAVRAWLLAPLTPTNATVECAVARAWMGAGFESQTHHTGSAGSEPPLPSSHQRAA